MATITFKGTKISTIGALPAKGLKAPAFSLTKIDLTDVLNSDFAGKKILFNIFPSIDTPVCATSVRQFNKSASLLKNTVVLCVSMDLPFAHARFCGAEGLDKVVSLSAFRSKSFGTNFGVTIIEGPFSGLLSRAIVITGTDGKVLYTEQVPEITQEPNYKAALDALK
jgi:thioredoxin-dependent peroxiredoxin